MACMARESQAEEAEVRSRSSARATRIRQLTGLHRDMERPRDITRTFFKVLHQAWHGLGHAPLRFKGVPNEAACDSCYFMLFHFDCGL